MKNLYKSFICLLPTICIILISLQASYAQCPDGQPAGGTAYDTTIVFETGLTSMPVKFAQFDPQNGMVTVLISV